MDEPPLRPIVSGNSSPVEHLSQYDDLFMLTFVPALPAFLGYHNVLKIINNYKCDSESILVTLDVQSLYTNSPHDTSLQALSRYPNTRPEGLLPPSNFILSLTKKALTSNDFQYAGSFYQQIQSTAMGIDFAPNNANVFMGHWEETFIYDVQKKTYFQNITLWKRYIDDILLVWNGTEGLLSELIS